MSKLAKEWAAKAEGDFNSALREYRARKHPNFDAAGFHAQQCVEKYLKAILQFHEVPFQKTHDLLALMELCIEFYPELEFEKESLAFLGQFAITFRYPGESATRDQAKTAIKMLKRLVPHLKTKLK